MTCAEAFFIHCLLGNSLRSEVKSHLVPEFFDTLTQRFGRFGVNKQ